MRNSDVRLDQVEQVNEVDEMDAKQVDANEVDLVKKLPIRGWC